MGVRWQQHGYKRAGTRVNMLDDGRELWELGRLLILGHILTQLISRNLPVSYKLWYDHSLFMLFS